MDVGKIIVDWFETSTPDLDGIYSNAYHQDMFRWRTKHLVPVATQGGMTMIVPGAHIVALALDVQLLVYHMSVCGYGIGAIHGYQNGHGNILEKEDIALILAHWVGDENIKTAMGSKIVADIAIKIGGKLGVKLIAKEFGKMAGLLIGQKLAGKVGAKIGVKFGAKIGAKIPLGWIPFLGVLIGAGINSYLIRSISNSADEYYRWKCRVISDL